MLRKITFIKRIVKILYQRFPVSRYRIVLLLRMCSGNKTREVYTNKSKERQEVLTMTMLKQKNQLSTWAKITFAAEKTSKIWLILSTIVTKDQSLPRQSSMITFPTAKRAIVPAASTKTWSSFSQPNTSNHASFSQEYIYLLKNSRTKKFQKARNQFQEGAPLIVQQSIVWVLTRRSLFLNFTNKFKMMT